MDRETGVDEGIGLGGFDGEIGAAWVDSRGGTPHTGKTGIAFAAVPSGRRS